MAWAKINFLFVLFLLLQVAADRSYILLVTVKFYDNPSQRCEECGQDNLSQTCCDARRVDNCTAEVEAQCDNRFYYCLRELGRADVETDPLNCGPVVSMVNTDASAINFEQSTVLGLSNPLLFTGPTSAWEGIQLYIEVEDDDSSSTDNTVDAFLIDIPPTSLRAGDTSPNQNYTGVFGWATIGLQYRLVCGDGLAGPTCSQDSPCLQVDCGRGECVALNTTSFRCECEGGFTGDKCELIDHCYQVQCGRGTCVNQAGNFLCQCEPGFAGTSCEVNVNECTNNNCSGRGQCVDTIDTHLCFCDSGYTGANCERLAVPLVPILGAVAGAVTLVLLLVGVGVCIALGRCCRRKRRKKFIGSKIQVGAETTAVSRDLTQTAAVAVPTSIMMTTYSPYNSPLVSSTSSIAKHKTTVFTESEASTSLSQRPHRSTIITKNAAYASLANSSANSSANSKACTSKEGDRGYTSLVKSTKVKDPMDNEYASLKNVSHLEAEESHQYDYISPSDRSSGFPIDQ